ncbi:MAG: V-type ATP synthase subunit E family protein [Anaerolineae bacterium]
MPLADILKAIDAVCDAEVARIVADAAAAVAAIRADTERDCAAIRERHAREMLLPFQHERARRLNRAHIAAARAVSRAQEELFAEAIAAAQARLGQLRGDTTYAAILAALVCEAMAQIGPDAVLRGDPCDEALLRRLAPGTPLTLDLTTWGGIEARSPDGRIAVINTLEARLAQAQPILRARTMPLFAAPSAGGESEAEGAYQEPPIPLAVTGP